MSSGNGDVESVIAKEKQRKTKVGKFFWVVKQRRAVRGVEAEKWGVHM